MTKELYELLERAVGFLGSIAADLGAIRQMMQRGGAPEPTPEPTPEEDR